MRPLRLSVMGALALVAGTASADPRFPAPVALLATGAEPVVGLNVGLLSRPRPDRAWELSCPADASGDVFGYDRDPARPNRALARLAAAVAVTDDLGCTWVRSPRLAGQVVDAGFLPDRPGEIWALLQVQGRLGVQVLALPDLAVREVSRIPWAVEVENAGFVGGQHRMLVAAFDPASGGPVLLEGALPGEDWRLQPIAPGTGERPRLVRLAPGDSDVVVRLMGAGTDRLAISQDRRTFHMSPGLAGYARAIWRDPGGSFLVALREDAGNRLLRLDPDWVVVQATGTPFSFGALHGQAGHILGLSYALGQDPPLLESRDDGVTWVPAMKLEQLRLRPDCAAVNPTCAEGCLSLASARLVSSSACLVAQATDGDGEGAGGCTAGGRSVSGSAWSLLAVLALPWLLRRGRVRATVLSLLLAGGLVQGCADTASGSPDGATTGGDAAPGDQRAADIAAVLDLAPRTDTPGMDGPPTDGGSPAPPHDGGGPLGADAAAAYPSADMDFTGDPGSPPQVFGPLCAASVQRGLLPRVELGVTVYATSRPNSRHFYVHFNDLPNPLASAYTSLVYASGPWQPGIWRAPAAGRIELAFRDGARFTGAGVSDLELVVSHAAPAPTPGDPTHYLRATLAATLRGQAAGDETVDLRLDCP